MAETKLEMLPELGWILVRKEKDIHGVQNEFLDASRKYCRPLQDGIESVGLTARQMAESMMAAHPDQYTCHFPVYSPNVIQKNIDAAIARKRNDDNLVTFNSFNSKQTHAEFEQLRKSATTTNAWDWLWSDGDTIKEKFAKLHQMVSALCLGRTFKALVVCKEPLASVLSDNVRLKPAYSQMGEQFLTYIGEVADSYGHDDGYHNDFLLYQDDQFPDDEVLVVVDGRAKVIKVFNNPLLEAKPK